MKYIKKYWIEIVGIIFLIASFISIKFYINIFGTNGISKNSTSEWGTFGDYVGGVVGTILSLLSVVLIYKTYKSQVKSAGLQQFETTFFNLMETYRLSVERLHRRNDALKKEYNEFYYKKCEKTKEQYIEVKSLSGKDFFDILYFILDGYYNRHIDEGKCHERIASFFVNQYWQIGHYIRNFISIIKFVDDKNDVVQKEFYINILRDMATIDELRLLFYATIWKGNDEGKNWKKLFNQYHIFDYIGNDKIDKKLIVPEFDLKAYEDIP